VEKNDVREEIYLNLLRRNLNPSEPHPDVSFGSLWCNASAARRRRRRRRGVDTTFATAP
jgi:hypothetical protein